MFLSEINSYFYDTFDVVETKPISFPRLLLWWSL